MTRVRVEEICRDMEAYLRRVEGGETLVVEREGRPVAEISPPACPGGEPRPFGLCQGEFRVPDDFDAPLPEDALRAFEGK